MYKHKPIFPQKSDEKEKTYLHRLLGRMNRLRKMIVRRTDEVLPKYQSEIDKIDLEILKLQMKKDKWLKKRKETYSEMDEVRSELSIYLQKVEPMLDNRDISPTFQIRILNRKLKSGNKIYFEGRVRGRMIKGYRSPDYTHQCGDENTVREIILKEYGVDTDTINRYERDRYLEKLLKQYWIEDLETISLD
jgi:hypothetical protein